MSEYIAIITQLQRLLDVDFPNCPDFSNLLTYPSGKRVCSMDELKLMAGFFKEFKFIFNLKKTYGQMLADTVDPFQAEFNKQNVLHNLIYV